MNSKSLQHESLQIIVLVKQIPDIEKVRFDTKKGHIDRNSAGVEVNPFDLNALEAAVQIKEKIGGIISVVSMGPIVAEKSLRDSLARGADHAFLLTDRRFAGSDTLATSWALAKAIIKIGKVDLIICGEKTMDGDTSQVGPEVAQILNIPHVAYVEEIRDINKKHIIVKTRLERNSYVIQMDLPSLITVTRNLNQPRFPTLNNKIRSKKTKITIWNMEDLACKLGFERFGSLGSATWVAKVFFPKNNSRMLFLTEGSPEEKVRNLVTVLKNHGIRRKST